MHRNLPFVMDNGKVVTMIGNGYEGSNFIGILLEKHTDGYLVAKIMPDKDTQIQMVFSKMQ